MVAALGLIMVSLSGCHIHEEYMEMAPTFIFKASIGLFLFQQNIVCPEPADPYDLNFSYESKSFYAGLDTSIIFKGYREKMSFDQKMTEQWALLDWRLRSIDVITLVDYDQQHPAGSSLNDIMGMRYYYKFSERDIPLKDFKYGDLMLSDFCGEGNLKSFLRLYFIGHEEKLLDNDTYEVHIEDAFGQNIFLKPSDTFYSH